MATRLPVYLSDRACAQPLLSFFGVFAASVSCAVTAVRVRTDTSTQYHYQYYHQQQLEGLSGVRGRFPPASSLERFLEEVWSTSISSLQCRSRCTVSLAGVPSITFPDSASVLALFSSSSAGSRQPHRAHIPTIYSDEIFGNPLMIQFKSLHAIF